MPLGLKYICIHEQGDFHLLNKTDAMLIDLHLFNRSLISTDAMLTDLLIASVIIGRMKI